MRHSILYLLVLYTFISVAVASPHQTNSNKTVVIEGFDYIALNQAGTRAAIASGIHIKLVNLSDKTVVRRFSATRPIKAIALHPTEDIVVVHAGGRIVLFRPKKEPIDVGRRNGNGVASIRFTDSGTSFFQTDVGDVAWATSTGAPIHSWTSRDCYFQNRSADGTRRLIACMKDHPTRKVYRRECYDSTSPDYSRRWCDEGEVPEHIYKLRVEQPGGLFAASSFTGTRMKAAVNGSGILYSFHTSTMKHVPHKKVVHRKRRKRTMLRGATWWQDFGGRRTRLSKTAMYGWDLCPGKCSWALHHTPRGQGNYTLRVRRLGAKGGWEKDFRNVKAGFLDKNRIWVHDDRTGIVEILRVKDGGLLQSFSLSKNTEVQVHTCWLIAKERTVDGSYQSELHPLCP